MCIGSVPPVRPAVGALDVVNRRRTIDRGQGEPVAGEAKEQLPRVCSHTKLCLLGRGKFAQRTSIIEQPVKADIKHSGKTDEQSR